MIDLAGTWALELLVASTTEAPLLGRSRTVSRTRLLVTVARAGEGWVQRQTVCTTRLEGGTKLARTTLPPAWRAALPDRSYPVELALSDGAWSYRADTGVQVVGYDPARGDLPLRAAEPQVVDSDRDGRPGATVLVEVPGFGTAEVWVAQRGHSRLEGRVVSPDRIEGSVVNIEQRQATIGASHRMFDFTPDARFDASGSTFAMWRVEAGSGCGSLGG